MGVNYYAVRDICEHCGRSDAKLHIGKLSDGWSFSFYAVDACEAEGWLSRPIVSWADWQEALSQPGVTICDEYDVEVLLDELWAIVDDRKGGRNHTTYMREEFGRKQRIPAHIAVSMAEKCFLDPEGHVFCSAAFS